MNLKDYRTRLGLKQVEVANILGISEGAYSRYEHGTRTPRPKLAKKLAKLYGLDWTRFYDEGDEHGEVRDDPASG